MTITLFLSAALLCTPAECFPALVGKDTPTGTFALHRRFVNARGFGGDVLQFHETDAHILAIHRVWLGKPSERRLERLQSPDPQARRNITNGCVNVMPEVYDKLLAAHTLEIKP
ncbi:hypothetical protein [Thermaurantiacus sp.]